MLDMGEPVKIIDLARRMVTLSGLTVRDEIHPHGDIVVQVIGLRPGEKLYEELLTGDNPSSTAHPQIMQAREPFLSLHDLRSRLNELIAQVEQPDVTGLRRILAGLVQGFPGTAETLP